MPAQTIYLERNSDAYVTSYDVWAKRGSYPQDEGDGVFVGNVAIQPSASSVSQAWTPPNDGTWYFGALSVYNRAPGIFFQLNGT